MFPIINSISKGISPFNVIIFYSAHSTVTMDSAPLTDIVFFSFSFFFFNLSWESRNEAIVSGCRISASNNKEQGK